MLIANTAVLYEGDVNVPLKPTPTAINPERVSQSFVYEPGSIRLFISDS